MRIGDCITDEEDSDNNFKVLETLRREWSIRASWEMDSEEMKRTGSEGGAEIEHRW